MVSDGSVFLGLHAERNDSVKKQEKNKFTYIVKKVRGVGRIVYWFKMCICLFN